MRYRVRHLSSYAYAQPVDLAHHMVRLTPRVTANQQVLDARIASDPAPSAQSEIADYFGNNVTFLSISDRHEHFAVEMTATVDVAFPRPPALGTTPPWEAVRERLCSPDGDAAMVEAAEFAQDSPMAGAGAADLVPAYAAESFRPGRPLLDAVFDLTRRIHDDFTFDAAATEVSTPLAEVMENRRGVCQDFAHVELAALRSVGIAARYVSGYIRTYQAANGTRLAGADVSHAWVSVFCPGVGWIDVDPTNNLVAREEHIVLAWGRDYGDVSPIRGVILGGGEHALSVAVDVVPLG
jgi:transglutaminase-like putative cysteine protease